MLDRYIFIFMFLFLFSSVKSNKGMVMWLQKILVIFSCFSANLGNFRIKIEFFWNNFWIFLAALSDAQAPDIIDVPSLIPAGEDLDLKCRSTVGLHSLRWIYPKNAVK